MTGYLLAGVALVILVVFIYGRRSGKDSQKVKQSEQHAKAAERVVESQEHHASNLNDVTKRLRDGSGKL